jgi:hypothetical protein
MRKRSKVVHEQSLVLARILMIFERTRLLSFRARRRIQMNPDKRDGHADTLPAARGERIIEDKNGTRTFIIDGDVVTPEKFLSVVRIRNRARLPCLAGYPELGLLMTEAERYLLPGG